MSSFESRGFAKVSPVRVQPVRETGDDSRLILRAAIPRRISNINTLPPHSYSVQSPHQWIPSQQGLTR